MRKPAVLLIAVAVCGLFAGTAEAKLTPAEQTWAKPLIQIWNVQNAGLHLVGPQAAAKNAMVAGEKPQNLALTKTLYALISCKQPTDLVKKAGIPPSPRLTAFRDALSTACIHNGNGANDIAKAIGAFTKGNGTLEGSYLTKASTEFKLGSAAIATAYKVLIAIGGKSIFVA